MLAAFTSARTLFGEPNWRRVWAIGGLAGVARWLEFLALGIYAFEITGSPELVALLAVVRMAPFVVLGFFMGALADRLDHRTCVIVALTLVLASSASMATLAWLEALDYTAVVISAACSGLFWVTDMPFRRRILVDSVGPSRVAAALGFDASTANATRMIGPIAGGAVYQALGVLGIFMLIAAIYAWCVLLAFALTTASSRPPVPPGKLKILELILPPRELILNPLFLVIMGVTLVYNLWCFPFIAMIPVFAQKDFALAPLGIGMLSACEGIGATLGALAVGLIAREQTFFRYYFFGPLAILVLLSLLSLALVVEAAAVALLLIGIASACFSATQYALVYFVAPPHMRGRAAGFLAVCIGSAAIGFYNAGHLFETHDSADAMRIMALQGAIPLLVLGALWLVLPRAAPVQRRA